MRKNDWICGVVGVVWLGGIVAGFAAWERYDAHPGEVGRGDEDQLASGRWSLAMFAHPYCPCMRANLTELRELLVQASAEVDARVVLVRPNGAAEGWERGPVYEQANRIPGVRVECDLNGVEASRAGANVSGHVVLHAPDGRLAFRGGVTKARGRVGDNVGRQTVLALLRGESDVQREVPVFGCPLFSAGLPCDGGKNACPR